MNKPTTPTRAPTSRAKPAGITAVIALILGGVYAVEGGYVNHPKDPGGATIYGVTEVVARQAGYRGDMRYFPKHCTGTVKICADKIYVDKYIVAPGFMPVIEVEPAVGQELVHSGVNLGPRKPSCWFQQSINEISGQRIDVDCKIGPRTVAAYRVLQSKRGVVATCVLTLERLDAKQEAEYRRLVRVQPSTYRPFLKGWLNHRIGNVDRNTCGRGIQ